jgi:murein DD-endopeptidase MepM/ murein hydrolase activator NlpD
MSERSHDRTNEQKNRWYTVMVVPEKTQRVRRYIVPAWVFRGASVGFGIFVLVLAIMFTNYWSVIGQISENRDLKLENRRLKQQVQVFENKIATIESTMERVKSFATRLKVITNIADRDNLLQTLNGPLPDAATNIATASDSASPEERKTLAQLTLTDVLYGEQSSSLPPEELQLKREFEALDERFSELNRTSLGVEEMLQDQYELLADQRAFLSALPTRKPVVGYFTNGFGMRRSPFGGTIKMHEGLDIANRPGTLIRSPADGTVAFSDSRAGYGRTVIVDHGYGIETWYGHTQQLLVKKGDKVRRGQELARLGSTGRSTGPHLHYEVRVHGTPVDPLTYILEN